MTIMHVSSCCSNRGEGGIGNSTIARFADHKNVQLDACGADIN